MDNNEIVGLELSRAGEKMLQDELTKLTANSQERLAGFMNPEEFSQHNGATLRIWDGFPWGDNRLAKNFLRRLLTLFPEEESASSGSTPIEASSSASSLDRTA